ncbi:hypothetical protein DRQ09_08095, partial [candidate division KSB1 bacterium]
MESSEQTVKPEEKKGVISFRENLTSGNFEEARRIEREEFIPINVVRSVVNTVFDTFVAERKYRQAIK